MDRHYSLVLIATLWGCNLNIPIEYHIASSCTEDELEAKAIREAAAAWNKAACAEIMKYNDGAIDGRFDLSDLSDDYLAVYCVLDHENNEANTLLDSEGVNMSAKSLGDIVLRRYEINRWAKAYYLEKKGNEKWLTDYYYSMLKTITIHEFGHQLYKSEANETGAYSVMHQDRMSDLAAERPTKYDVYGSDISSGVCDLIDCPPPDQCPTRPIK